MYFLIYHSSNNNNKPLAVVGRDPIGAVVWRLLPLTTYLRGTENVQRRNFRHSGPYTQFHIKVGLTKVTLVARKKPIRPFLP